MGSAQLRLLPVLAAAVLASGCWDAPIRETLELDFHGDGSARATLVVGLDAPTLHGTNADDPVRKRLVAKAAALEDGSDPWLRRFDVEDCPRQGGSWQRDSGDLTEFRRFMECTRGDAALELLAGSNLGVTLRENEGTARLAIEPLGAGPAPRADRERALAALDEWAGGLERYYAAAFALARRATERPDLARDLWIVAFADDAGEPSRELAPEDAALAGGLRQALDGVVRILRPRTGESETADELSRRVFDPLPARLVVTVPVEPVASSGFVRRGERRYAAPERGFYAAFARLEGRWLAADPLVARVERGRAASETPLAVEPFCAAGFLRADAPPEQAEIRAALLAELEARTRLELSWKGPIEVEEVAPPESAP